MIRVLHIYGDLEVAGTQTVIMNYLRYMHKDAEIALTLLVNGVPKGSAYEQECQEKGYSVVYSGYQSWNGPKGLRALINWFRCQRYIYREIRRNKPDIIHTHITSNLPFVMIPVMLSGSKRWFHTLHSDPDVFSKPIAWLARCAFNCFGVHPICVTPTQARKAVQRYGIKKYTIIRNGIDINRFVPVNHTEIRHQFDIADTTTVIGCVGRLEKIKNHQFLVRLFAEYSKHNNNAILMLVGEGDERDSIKALADSLGVGDKLLFAGVFRNIEQMYYAMDMFMLTSFHESSSIVTIEAQLANLKCVIADSIPEDVVVTHRVNRIPLSAPTSTWIAAMKDELPYDRQIGTIEEFSIDNTIRTLKQLYMQSYNDIE